VSDTGQVERAAHRQAMEQSRWVVHVALLGTFAGALVVLVLSQSIVLHILLGLAFGGFVVVHLAQRRRTVRRLTRQLFAVTLLVKPQGRIAVADCLLAFLTLNVLVSGVVDWVDGYNVAVPFLGGQGRFSRWHTDAAILLLVFLVVHVSRRWSKLGHSHIR
jgi:hypothetical protein